MDEFDNRKLESILSEMNNKEISFLKQLPSKKLQIQYMSILKERINLSLTDSLTGVWDAGARERNLEVQENFAKRHQTTYSFLDLDLDYFKDINDSYGHPVGDDVLRNVADYLLKNTRKEDLVFRQGGEEFSILLPDISSENAVKVAEKLRKTIEDKIGIIMTNGFPEVRNTPSLENNYTPITASVGVCNRGDVDSIEELLQRTDEALYFAKDQGRNRVAYFKNGEISIYNPENLNYDEKVSYLPPCAGE